jgi:glycosyltransferase involved in cell wall biosynthesis
MKEGLVSVIIPTFGRSQFLKRCVESVSSQTYDNIEIIIVDDNGKGQLQQLETATVVDSIKCRFPLHYLIQDENRGGSAARNAGAKHAQGEFIAFLDDDDQFEEDRVLKQIHFLKEKAYQNPQIKACTCW